MLLYGFVECMLVALQRIGGWSSGQQWLISGALQLCKLALLATVGAQHSSVSLVTRMGSGPLQILIQLRHTFNQLS
jgi:hypothetical protein